MTNNQKITFSYALTYMAAGLAVNNHTLLSILSCAVACAMLVPQKSLKLRDTIFPSLTLAFQLAVIIMERQQFDIITSSLLPAVMMCMIHSFLLLLRLARMNNANRIAIISSNAIIFLSFSLIMIAMDIIIKQLIPSGGILRGFWLMTILFGSNILASLLLLLFAQSVSLRKTVIKTKLS